MGHPDTPQHRISPDNLDREDGARHLTDFLQAHRQRDARVRLEWGPTGALALAPTSYAVVVDVLCFTTTLTVAVERGITVWPFPWRDDRAAAYAAERDAVLAVSRSVAGPGDLSLAPGSFARADGVERAVLPSPNGSTISALLTDSGATVVGASLRNAAAVVDWLAAAIGADDTIAVIPAGERWPDGSLRPAVEDLWGAGAVVAGLADRGLAELSPEARVAESAFRAVRPRLAEQLAGCASGREQIAAGYADDVRVAAEADESDAVPVLVDGAFRAV
ncbi:2-phosphosulfolactate phosphatase [Nocardioides cheoyonin]|uniref:2-phosphosulfolactate phosphatase n=1 Tax=Nocardioides cheoyonin TaxID=3156615 RepID=UPI0032B3DDB7